MQFTTFALYLFLVAFFLALPTCTIATECPAPVEPQVMSLCALCSDEHAGVRWIRSKSVEINSLRITFKCTNEEGNETLVSDECFGDVRLNPSTILSESGRVHMIGEKLLLGTTCNFTARYFNVDTWSSVNLSTTCSIKNSSECSSNPQECHLPASCTLTGDQCQCACTAGYMVANPNASYTPGLPCERVLQSPSISSEYATKTASVLASVSVSVPLIATRGEHSSGTIVLSSLYTLPSQSFSQSRVLSSFPQKQDDLTTGPTGTAPFVADGILKSLVPVILVALIVLFTLIMFLSIFLVLRRRRKVKVLKFYRTGLTSSTFDVNFMPIKIDDKRHFSRLSQHSIFNALEYDEDKDEKEKLNFDDSSHLIESQLPYQDSEQSTCSDSTQYLSNSSSLETSMEVLDQEENGDNILIATNSDPNHLERKVLMTNLNSFVEVEHDGNLMSTDDSHHHIHGTHVTPHVQVRPMLHASGDAMPLTMKRSGDSFEDSLKSSSRESRVQAHTHGSINNGYVTESKGQTSPAVSLREGLMECASHYCDEYQITDLNETDTGKTNDAWHSILSLTTPRINSTDSFNTDYDDSNSPCGSDCPQEYEVCFTSNTHTNNSHYVTHPPVDTHSLDSGTSADFLSSVCTYPNSSGDKQSAKLLHETSTQPQKDECVIESSSTGNTSESTGIGKYVKRSTGSGYIIRSKKSEHDVQFMGIQSGYVHEFNTTSSSGYVPEPSTNISSSGYVHEPTTSSSGYVPEPSINISSSGYVHEPNTSSSGYVPEPTTSSSGYVHEPSTTSSGYVHEPSIPESKGSSGYLMGSTSSGYVTESTSSDMLDNMISYLEDYKTESFK